MNTPEPPRQPAHTHTTHAGDTHGASHAGHTHAGEEKLEVIEEQLTVGKREVESGGVRVRRFTTEQNVTENVQLREEHVNVERHKVDRPVGDADFQERTIEVRETSEVPVVAKEARVVEEITIGKEIGTRTEQVSGTVRRTDIEIQQLEGENKAHFDRAYSGKNYADYQPAYAYGARAQSDQRYAGREYSTFENDLRADYERQNPNSKWEEVKDAVRNGYDNAKRRFMA